MEQKDMAGLEDRLKRTNLREDDNVERLVIGLDFGTTYSGVGYAFTTQPDKIYTIDEWPGRKGKGFPKCPTLIRYTGDGGKDGFQWGYELDRTDKGLIEGIKLLLDPSQPKPLYVPAIDTEAELKQLGKPAIAVATDYIGAILQYAYQKIEGKYPKGYLESIEKRYVLSVPAVWSDKAKDVTRRAARNAGISNLSLIKEPEAAALFTLHGMGNKGLEVGDALVLCDAGGGTVDLISYEIKSLRPLDLIELTPATGGQAGSLMLNKRFEEWLRSVVGDRAYLKLRETDAYRLAMRVFDENIKPEYRSISDKDQYLNFPNSDLKDNLARGLNKNTITVTGKALHTVFEPIFLEINRLVNDQVNAVRLKRIKDRHPKGFDIKAIFLVGGFGGSGFLCENISNANMDIQVIQPNDAWSAIVRGAVMSQLPTEARVVSSVAPKHYGVSASSRYDASRDAGQNNWYDNLEDTWKVSTMTWYIEKGDDLERSRKIEFPFYRAFDHKPSGRELIFEDDLLECNLSKRPVHPKEGVVLSNCTLKADLSALPENLINRSQRKATNGDSFTVWEIHYKLLVTIQSGPMRFSLLAGGKEYGNVESKY